MRTAALSLALCVSALSLTSYAENTTQQIENVGLQRTAEGKAAQDKIDDVHEDTQKLIDDYYTHLKLVDGLKKYNHMLEAQLNGQREEIGALENSIQNVAVMERQILPLLDKMLDSLEQFIAIDVPFLKEERDERVGKLRKMLLRSDVTAAEKARRVFEAFQIENEYGRTIEAYRDKLAVNGASFDADFLRIGRIGLLYKVVGSGETGFWSTAENQWLPLAESSYRRYVEQGLKIARQEMAPELITIPVDRKVEIHR